MLWALGNYEIENFALSCKHTLTSIVWLSYIDFVMNKILLYRYLHMCTHVGMLTYTFTHLILPLFTVIKARPICTCIYMYRPRCSFDYNKAKKKLNLCCPHPTKIWKLGRSVGIFLIFLIFFTYRERVEFSNKIFLKVSKWGKLGRNAVKTHIQVMQVLF